MRPPLDRQASRARCWLPRSGSEVIDALERCQRALGADHPTTLTAAATLTFALAGIGDHQQARVLGQDALERYRRALGANHLTTLRLAQVLESLT
jgi:hypothetical protein